MEVVENKVRLIHGFGINDADYHVQPRVNGTQIVCPAYKTWKNMISRVHSPASLNKYPTYQWSSICNEWRSFMKFREWWLEHHIDGWHLDKDILSSECKYSPETCIYIPEWLNCFASGLRANTRDLPVGVSIHPQSGKYHSRCNNPISKKQEHLGLFLSAADAKRAWSERKKEFAMMIKIETDKIDERIYQSLIIAIGEKNEIE